MARGRPRWTPASIIDSTTKKMYAGPEPEIAVTASICRSGIRSTLPTEAISASASARWPSSQWEPGEIAAMPSSTRAGVFGMTRTTATPSGTRDSMNAVVMPAASETTSWPGRSSRGDLVEQVAHVLRLDHEREGVGLAGGLDVGDHGDAVPLLELAGALGALLADQQVVDPAAGADQAGEQGLAHHAGAEDRGLGDAVGGASRAAYFFEIRDFTKNDRFCGRSASLLMR